MSFFKDGLGKQHPQKALSTDIANLSSLERGIVVLVAALSFPAAAHQVMVTRFNDFYIRFRIINNIELCVSRFIQVFVYAFHT